MILSAAMMLDWLGTRRERDDLVGSARRLRDAVDAVLADVANHTPDLGGGAGTADFGEAVAREIEKAPAAGRGRREAVREERP